MTRQHQLFALSSGSWLVLAALAACNGEPAVLPVDQACAPGTLHACACPGGKPPSVQECLADGSGFGSCKACPGAGAGDGAVCADTLDTLHDCGKCGAPCEPAHVLGASCAERTCHYLGGCVASYQDCDGDAANGCESDRLADPQNCGVCGASCATAALAHVSKPLCVAGKCDYLACAAGFNDCDGNRVNGCESDPQSDVDNCGGCSLACKPAHVSAATCSAGKCGYGKCLDGFLDCDAKAVNGCEIDSQSDPLHCGGCAAAPCGGNEDCIAGKCVPYFKSCKAYLTANPGAANGVYKIDPDGGLGPLPQTSVHCDMKRDGGGWTLGVKTWYNGGSYGNAGAIGSVNDATTLLGNPYKLSDNAIRAIIGPTNNFDVMADQAGYNDSYSNGNFEYVILRNYTAMWKFDGPVANSSTQTLMQSYRLADDALAWTGILNCGNGGAGINCYDVIQNNPAGGGGCQISMGKQTDGGWHHFYMGETNSDTYLYICNGAQHSSGHNMNHRFWFRERN